ncbi:MAG: hypothetical protein FWE86_02590, partial [Oscillospiraceae bacterium]|nr:hypothetical protein [Oscillospiraceae bacterium]
SDWGLLNHEAMKGSFAQLEEELSEYIGEALARAGAKPEEVAYGVFGLSGVDSTYQHEIVSKILRGIGISEFTLRNDAFLGVAAGCEGGVGIGCVNGTGSNIAAVDYDGKFVQLEGVGDISHDSGGGAWYSNHALCAVFDQLFISGSPETVLTKMLFEMFDVKSKEEYLDTMVVARAKLGVRKFYERINPLCFEAAGKGDRVALNILDASAKHYAGCIEYLAKNLCFPEDKPLYVALCGSVFVKEKVRILPELIAKYVGSSLGTRPVEFVIPDVDPVAGAILWASQKAGAEMSMAHIRDELTASRTTPAQAPPLQGGEFA